MGVMGLPMAKNVVQKCGLPVLGYDVVQQQMDAFREAGGIPVSDPAEIYKACDVILQILPTHPIIRNSVEQAIQYGKPGNVIVDLSSTAPDIILELYQQAKDAGMFLLDSPVSGGNPMAIAGTLAIMTGGDKEAFDKVKPVLACMGSPVYTGGPASGSVTKLSNIPLLYLIYKESLTSLACCFLASAEKELYALTLSSAISSCLSVPFLTSS